MAFAIKCRTSPLLDGTNLNPFYPTSYTWSQSKISLLNPLKIGSKLTFAGCSGLQLLYSAMFIVHSELNYYMTQLQIFQKVEYGGGPIFKLVLKC